MKISLSNGIEVLKPYRNSYLSNPVRINYNRISLGVSESELCKVFMRHNNSNNNNNNNNSNNNNKRFRETTMRSFSPGDSDSERPLVFARCADK